MQVETNANDNVLAQNHGPFVSLPLCEIVNHQKSDSLQNLKVCTNSIAG